MADITQLILDEHDRFRRQFAQLDDLRDDAERAAPIWSGLAAALEVHASAEEEHFYPALLALGDETGDGPGEGGGAVDETEDAIGDHDDIREGVRRAEAATLGSADWWQAIDDTRAANTEHMGEEEDEALADARRNMSLELREELGVTFQAFTQQHPGAKGLSTEDTGAEQYLEAHAPE